MKSKDVKLNHASLHKLIQSIRHTCDEEPACEEVYDLLDQYTEQVLQGGSPQDLMPLVYQHLEVCADCHEEYEMLLDILKSKRP